MEKEFIQELQELFYKYNVSLEIDESYDGEDRYSGDTIGIISRKSIDGLLPIYIDDIRKMAEEINKRK